VATVPFLDVGAAYRELHDEITAAVSEVLDSGWYLLGRAL
jgi:dTDP-4-amino-4,6-dideoxygalactose transaminase